MEALFQKLGENIGYVLIPVIIIILVWIKEKLEKFLRERKKLSQESVSVKSIKVHSELNELLTEFRLLSDAARVSIIQFHNGEYFYNGSPILRFSMTHESCARGVFHSINNVQNYYLSAYYQLIELSQKPYEIYFTENLKESNFKGFMDSNNTICFVLLPIKCHKNINIVGLILVEWCSVRKSEAINKDEIQKISEKFSALIKNIINNQKSIENIK